ncbi:MAG: dihydroorotate dehydrogenase [Planctomycetes bacterium]|nr:dihydroorotate dehydrogenase [Planctomycetota bacterium]
MSACDLSVRIASLVLRNPVLSASGTYGHGLEMGVFTAAAELGAWVSKTVTLEPRGGNPAPRICETEAGLLNSIGLENRGLEHYIAHTLPLMAAADTVVVTNIGGERVQDFAELARRLDGESAVDALEVNLSCPNVQGGKLPFATDRVLAAEVVRAVRAATHKPIFAKLSPNTAGLGEIARAVEGAGADAITAVNTLLGLALDWRTRRPGLATVQGGYSGPGIKPVALRCAWECARAVRIPVIGCGGIQDAADALEYLVAGCTAVQVGTASFADPALPGKLAREMASLLAAQGIGSARELCGTIHDGREARDAVQAR